MHTDYGLSIVWPDQLTHYRKAPWILMGRRKAAFLSEVQCLSGWCAQGLWETWRWWNQLLSESSWEEHPMGMVGEAPQRPGLLLGGWRIFWWEWGEPGLSPPNLYFPRGWFSVLSLAFSTPNSAERNRGQTGWRQVPGHMSPSATREENERGGNARFRILPPVKHAGGSVHKHRLKQINQTWPKATEKATDASN